MQTLVNRPAMRLLRGWVDAEESAAEWMTYFGFSNVLVTPPSQDRGVDVVSDQGVAQVKAETQRTGRPALQRLYGEAVARSLTPLFFSLAGYRPPALMWADEVGMALFKFDLQGEPVPVNAVASTLSGLPLEIPAGASVECADDQSSLDIEDDRQGRCEDAPDNQVSPYDEVQNDDPTVAAHVALFGALADPTRLRLLRAIARTDDRRLGISAIAERIGISQPTASYHVRKLAQSGLVTVVRDGVFKFVSLEPSVVIDLTALLEADDDATACAGHRHPST